MYVQYVVTICNVWLIQDDFKPVCVLKDIHFHFVPPLRHIIRKVDIQPAKRMQQLDELERATLGGTRDMGPCGGFSTQYMCMCDYHALPYREEVAWDVDTIYLSHDTRELYLHDFDYLEQK